MRTQTLHPNRMATTIIDPRSAMGWLHGALDRFLLLPAGALIALVWANSSPESYFRFSHAAAFPVNEIAMASFLVLVAQDVFEAVMPGGVLHSWKHWGVPSIAAIGGLAGAAATFLVFVTLVGERVLSPAWPVAAAVDIGAGYYLMRLIYPRGTAVVSVLLLMAVITDTIVMAFVSIQVPEVEWNITAIVWLAAALGSAAALRRRQVRSIWPYLLGSGALAWYGVFLTWTHPVFALLLLVPLLPHRPRRREILENRHDPRDADYGLHVLAQVALFLFGLVNAGVILKQADSGTWAILVAAIVGRPAGVLIAVGLAVSAGLQLPRWLRWPDLTVVALATTSGFTFALFLAATVLPPGAVAQQITVGALATTGGALLTVVAAWGLGVGRFRRAA